MAAVGLQFPLRHPAVPVGLTGARSAAELAQNISAFDVEVPASLWDDLASSGLLKPTDTDG